jgi:parallel beta-helix repeat protein
VIIGAEGKRVSPQIIRNISYRNMGGGIGSMKKSTAVISENICFENYYAGIGHNDASPLVTNNICYKNIRAGIGVSEGACPLVRGNQCYNNRRAGIGVRTGAATRPVIEDNDCYQNGMSGIGIAEKAEPVIRNNRCYENTLAGIGSQDHARPKIIGNQCYRNQESGIGSEGGAEPLIKGNECFENVLAGIGQRGNAHTTLIDNYSHHNNASGIGFDNCETGRSTMNNNRVIDNSLVAVGIHTGWTVQLTGNELSNREGLPPIVMVFKGATATFTNNTIRGKGVAGIRVAGTITATDNQFEGLAITRYGPPNYAVWALEGASVTLSRNQISDWKHALFASAATVNANHNTVQNFHQTAFVVKNAPLPANVFGNIVVSQSLQDKVLEIQGSTGNVSNNELRSELPEKSGRRN